MRHKILKMGMLVGVLAVFAAGAIAQHEVHHPDSQATQTQPGMMGSGRMGGE